MKCSNCGKEIKLDYNQCPYCGQKIIKYNDYWIEKGYKYYKKKEYYKTIECYNKGLETDPENIKLYIAKGAVLTLLQKYEEALQCYNTALSFNPILLYQTKLYMLKASTYFQSGRYKKAIEDCDEVLKRLEFSGNKERSLGLWLPDIYYEIIYNYWNDPIDHTLNNPDKHRMLIIQGESYEKLGKKKNAKDCYSKALEINPNNRYLKARIEKLNNKEISDNNDLYKLANTYCPYCSGKLISKPDYCNHCGRKLSRTIKNGVEVVEQYKQDQYEKEINHNGKLETRWFGDLSILSIIGLVLGYIISYIFFSIVTPFYISGLKYFFLIPVIVPIFEIVGSAIEKKKIPFYFYIGNTIEMFIIYILFFMGYLSIFVTEKTIYDFLFSAELLKIIIPIIFISLIHYIIAGVIRLRRKLNIDELEVIAAYCFPLEIAIIILPLIFGFQVNI